MTKKSEYDMKYQAEKLKRIPFNVQKDYYENVLKPMADSKGEPMNTFIKIAIAERIARLKADNHV